ncbi:MAG: GHMP kinase [Acidobacteria bacterium]|nr:GHMP kinase [Acidobacteriota bacterium]
MRLHAYAPTRIDLAGGTLDIWPLFLFHPGALTVNLAISRYAHCVLEPRRDPRLVLVSRDSGVRAEFRSLAALESARRTRLPLLAALVRHFAPRRGLKLATWSEVPAGAGLGGSSALAVAVCAALNRFAGSRLSAADWIPLARDIEARVLGVPTGEQDHYPAVYGGASAVHLEPGRTWRERLPVDLAALEARLLLVYTGQPRRSSINNWQVLKNYLDGDRRLRRNFAEIAETAKQARAAVVKGDWSRLGRLIGREGRTRRRNAPAISTPFIDRLVRVGRGYGATAKVCGAGGGGCVIFFSSPGQRAELAAGLAAAGATLLPFRLARRGVRVEALR